MDVVYATGSFFVGLTRVDAGTVWPASDPIVVSHPEGFSPDPISSPGFRTTQAMRSGEVEQATAAPGEQRNVRRG